MDNRGWEYVERYSDDGKKLIERRQTISDTVRIEPLKIIAGTTVALATIALLFYAISQHYPLAEASTGATLGWLSKSLFHWLRTKI